MYLKFEKNNDKLIVDFIGELDHHSAEEVRVKVDDRIERDNIKKLILNFSGVTFMDSSGIGGVVGRFKKISSLGGSLSITNISNNVKKVFELSGLFKIIKNYDTVDEALKSM